MIDTLLRTRADVNNRLRQIPVVRAAIAGEPDHNGWYRRYLGQVALQYSPHSPRVMCLAASRCLDTHPELGLYLLHHAVEETGHARWAHEDLLALGVPEKQIQASRPVSACAAMVGYTYYLATQANPVALYGWMYVLEAVGADLGTDASAGLQRLFPGALRFVGGHAQADRKHTEELEQNIRQHITDAKDLADVVFAAEVSADLYIRMFEQIGM